MLTPRHDLELERRLARSVSMHDLRHLVWRELPDLFNHLPGEATSAAITVHNLFLLAANHGVEQPLRTALQRRWPGLFAPRLVYAVIGTGRPLLIAAHIIALGLALTLGLVLTALEPMVDPDAHCRAAPRPVPIPIITTADRCPDDEPPPPPPHEPPKIRVPSKNVLPVDKDLRSLDGALHSALLACGRSVGGVDLRVVLITDDRGTWSETRLPYETHATRQCMQGPLERLQKYNERQRQHFQRDAEETLVLHLPP